MIRQDEFNRKGRTMKRVMLSLCVSAAIVLCLVVGCATNDTSGTITKKPKLAKQDYLEWNCDQIQQEIVKIEGLKTNVPDLETKQAKHEVVRLERHLKILRDIAAEKGCSAQS